MKPHPSTGDMETAARGPVPVARITNTTPPRLENEIGRISGVRSARVIAEGDVLREIHVVADTSRAPKQVVRDVQSLASAGFGIAIDHRIVSVVQLDEDEVVERGPQRQRAVLERIVLTQEGNDASVLVQLTWPDGRNIAGTGVAGVTRETRARAGAQAVREAVAPVVSATVDVEQVLIQRVGLRESVTVHVVLLEDGVGSALVGSAIVHDDVASAAVRAALQALNRKLS